MNKSFIIFAITAFLVILSLSLILKYRKKKIRELKARIERENYNRLLNSFRLKIELANSEFEELITGNKYISNFDVFNYIATYKSLHSEIPFSRIETLAYEGEVKQNAKLLKSNFENVESLVNQANTGFVDSE